MPICAATPLLLASSSPRRRELLEQVGIPIVVGPVEVDESVGEGEDPDRYLERVVSAKLSAARRRLASSGSAALLVADTVVLLGGAILGKPESDADARAMLRRLAGRRHVVATRFAVASEAVDHAETVRTDVWFRELDEAAIERYLATGEGRDKAGSYALQGVGAMLVPRVAGSHTNVIGLPLAEVVLALEQSGLIEGCPVR